MIQNFNEKKIIIDEGTKRKGEKKTQRQIYKVTGQFMVDLEVLYSFNGKIWRRINWFYEGGCIFFAYENLGGTWLGAEERYIEI